MSEPEFYANATLGFRQWNLSLEATGELKLKAMVQRSLHSLCYGWNLKGPNHAKCMSLKHPKGQQGSLDELHGEVPGTGCSCGFYAYGRRDGSGSETSVRVVAGVVAGWGNVELHELGFKCSVAKILALFEPDLRKSHVDDYGVARKKWAALERICADNAIPLLPPDALKEDEEVRRYAWERDLRLLDDQLNFRRSPSGAYETV